MLIEMAHALVQKLAREVLGHHVGQFLAAQHFTEVKMTLVGTAGGG